MLTQGFTRVCGLQFGEEAKERMITFLLDQYDIVIKCNSSSIHPCIIYEKGKAYKLSILPVGILIPRIENFLVASVWIDVHALAEEISQLRKVGVYIDKSNLSISYDCCIHMPWEKYISGIYTLRRLMSDDFENVFIDRIEQYNTYATHVHETLLDGRKEFTKLQHDLMSIKPFLKETYRIIQTYCLGQKRILIQDEDNLFSPNPEVLKGSFGALPEIGMIGKAHTVGVLKPYLVSHSAYDIPTAIGSAREALIETKQEESYTASEDQQLHIGWLDIPAVQYTLTYGVSQLALMGLNVLSGIDEIYVCTKYIDVYKDQEVPFIPYYNDATVWYESFPGWRQDITGIRLFEKLPKEAQRFIRAIEHLCSQKLSYISTGIHKQDMIIR